MEIKLYGINLKDTIIKQLLAIFNQYQIKSLVCRNTQLFELFQIYVSQRVLAIAVLLAVFIYHTSLLGCILFIFLHGQLIIRRPHQTLLCLVFLRLHLSAPASQIEKRNQFDVICIFNSLCVQSLLVNRTLQATCSRIISEKDHFVFIWIIIEFQDSLSTIDLNDVGASIRIKTYILLFRIVQQSNLFDFRSLIGFQFTNILKSQILHPRLNFGLIDNIRHMRQIYFMFWLLNFIVNGLNSRAIITCRTNIYYFELPLFYFYDFTQMQIVIFGLLLFEEIFILRFEVKARFVRVRVGRQISLQEFLPAIKSIPSVIDYRVRIVRESIKRVSYQVEGFLLQILVGERQLNGIFKVSGEKCLVFAYNIKCSLLLKQSIIDMLSTRLFMFNKLFGNGGPNRCDVNVLIHGQYLQLIDIELITIFMQIQKYSSSIAFLFLYVLEQSLIKVIDLFYYQNKIVPEACFRHKQYKSIINRAIKFKQMSFLKFCSKTVRKMDLLSTSVNFRIRKQPQYETIFGGLISFIIMCLFGYLLYVQFTNMFSKLNITYAQGLLDDISSDTTITDVRFAVSINGVNLGATPRKFVFLFNQISTITINGTASQIWSPITLNPYQLSDWSGLGSDFISQYTAFGFDRMLCVSSSANMSITGYVGSSTYQYLNFQIVQCDQTIDYRCDNTTNINSYISNFLTNNDYFKVTFYMVDTIITPTNDQPIIKVLQKNIFMAFTNTVGTVGFINLAKFTLDTDTSYFPTTSIDQVTGSYIQSFQTNSVSISSTKYIDINIFKSTKSLSISRTIGKIDQVLSYVGGLFGILFTAIAFFLGSYSQMKYQMYVAESILALNQEGRRLTESDFGFCTFLIYSVYDAVDNLGIPPKCFKGLKQIHEIREQACEQLDPTIILRRIKYVEDVCKILISEHKEMCAYLTGPMTLSQAHSMRQTLTYYDRIIAQITYKNPQTLKQAIIENHNRQIHSGFNNKIQNSSKLDNLALKQSPIIIRDTKTQKQLSEQEEDRILQDLMFEAVQKLQSDNNEAAQRIKNKVSVKARELVKKIRTDRQIQSQLKQVEKIPNEANFEDNQSHFIFEETINNNQIISIRGKA